jgi:general L-amino acid transport system permease protein
MTAWARATLIEPAAPPPVRTTARVRWKNAWFPTPVMGVLSLVLLVAIVLAGWHFLQWALVHSHWSGTSSEACVGEEGACWAFVIARWKPWLVGGYPAGELWRAWTVFGLFIAFCVWIGRRTARGFDSIVLWSFVLLPVVLIAVLLGGGPLRFVPPTQWGGLLLTLIATLTTFATALPIGLALALGRRSDMPVLRFFCAAFVEAMRSIPLLALLFIAATLLPMFLPPGHDIDLFTRALGAFALFNAAMAAEVFRGGLQTVGRGQYEAATTVGLSRIATLRHVVLPQAISAVVPALVNIMIAVIKETTLLSVIGVNDFLGAIENGAKTPGWMGEANILTSGQVFLALVYLAVCWSLSRYSHRLETRR